MSDILSSLRDAYRKAETFRKQKNTKHYPEDFKRVVIDAYFKGITVNKMRTVVDLRPTTVYHWIQQSQQKENDEQIPVEWVKDQGNKKPAILLLPNGIKIEIPLSALDEVMGRVLKAS
jgi:hypothetical protein